MPTLKMVRCLNVTRRHVLASSLELATAAAASSPSGMSLFGLAPCSLRVPLRLRLLLPRHLCLHPLDFLLARPRQLALHCPHADLVLRDVAHTLRLGGLNSRHRSIGLLLLRRPPPRVLVALREPPVLLRHRHSQK